MFIRWQHRTRNSPSYGGYGSRLVDPDTKEEWGFTREDNDELDVHHNAVLVENRRVKGKPYPVARHVANLGGITDSAIAVRSDGCPIQCYYFWQRAEKAMSKVGLTEAQKEPIRAALAKVVPQLTPEQWAAGEDIEASFSDGRMAAKLKAAFDRTEQAKGL